MTLGTLIRNPNNKLLVSSFLKLFLTKYWKFCTVLECSINFDVSLTLGERFEILPCKRDHDATAGTFEEHLLQIANTTGYWNGNVAEACN